MIIKIIGLTSINLIFYKHFILLLIILDYLTFNSELFIPMY